MPNYSHRPLAHAALLALAVAAPPGCIAACSRDVMAPVSATGFSVRLNDDRTVGGIYPDLLRSLGAKSGCNFVFSMVPRARLEAMFEVGKADLLIPASRTAARDRLGLFVPLLSNRPALISLRDARAPVQNSQQLIERRELRLALVRGFDYGDEYRALVKELTRQNRVTFEVDPITVARLLKAGLIDATIMAPTILAGAIEPDPRVRDILDKLRLEVLDDLPWGRSGAYISYRSVTPHDRAALRELLGQAVKSGAVLDAFQRHQRPEVLALGVRAP